MSELDHYDGVLPSLLTPGGRALARDLAAVRRAATVSNAKEDGRIAFSAQVMHNLTGLDQTRRLLARGDETLNNLLTEVEIGHVICALNEQRTMFQRRY